MSQIESQPDFDFQKAGKDVLEIEREGLAQLDQYIIRILVWHVRRCSTVPAKSWSWEWASLVILGAKWPQLLPVPELLHSLFTQGKQHTA